MCVSVCDAASVRGARSNMQASCDAQLSFILLVITLVSFSQRGLSRSVSVAHTAGNFAWEFLFSKISVIVSGRVCNMHPRPKRGATVEVWMDSLTAIFTLRYRIDLCFGQMSDVCEEEEGQIDASIKLC